MGPIVGIAHADKAAGVAHGSALLPAPLGPLDKVEHIIAYFFTIGFLTRHLIGHSQSGEPPGDILPVKIRSGVGSKPVDGLRGIVGQGQKICVHIPVIRVGLSPLQLLLHLLRNQKPGMHADKIRIEGGAVGNRRGGKGSRSADIRQVAISVNGLNGIGIGCGGRR